MGYGIPTLLTVGFLADLKGESARESERVPARVSHWPLPRLRLYGVFRKATTVGGGAWTQDVSRQCSAPEDHMNENLDKDTVIRPTRDNVGGWTRTSLTTI